MFRLVGAEVHDLRFQIGISNSAGRGGRRYLPYVFTEQGVAMLSSVLHSKRAVHVNIAIMRALVKLREVVAIQRGLIRRVDEMESRNEDRFRFLIEAIRKCSPERRRRRIGFAAGLQK